MLENQPKGDPQVVSDTEGEDITPDNPEIVKQTPVENTEEAKNEVEENAGEAPKEEVKVPAQGVHPGVNVIDAHPGVKITEPDGRVTQR